MRVVHVSTGDIGGGAAVAAHRIHRGLCEAGIDSLMLVDKKLTDDPSVISPTSRVSEILATARSLIDTMPFRLYSRRRSMGWSMGWVPTGIHRRINALQPDIIHLHFVCGGLLPFLSVHKLNSPIVWTMHDMWAFTGGCHYNGDCTRFRIKCGSCPRIPSSIEHDLTRLAWKMKSSALKSRRIAAVGPSRWMTECASQSSVFEDKKVLNIPYGLDLAEFAPIDRSTARDILGLPRESRLIMFGALGALADERKGFRYLLEALKSLKSEVESENSELVIFGASAPDVKYTLPMKYHFIGRVYDSLSLRLLYSAADVFIAPSTEENLANTVLESLACGTPVVAFRIGGMPDMIRHRENGYLAAPLDAVDLASGIRWIFSGEISHESLRLNARRTIEEAFDIREVAQKYVQLYSEI